MYVINKKYNHVEFLIHNIDGIVVDLHGIGKEVKQPVSPYNPKGSSKIYPAATQEDLKKVFEAGEQDIVIFVKDETLPQFDVKRNKKDKQSDDNQL